MRIKKLSGNELIDKFAWIITVAYLVLTCILSTKSYAVVLLVLCATIIAVLSSIKNKGIIKFKIERFHIQWLLFGLFSLMSSLWALNSNKAITQGITIIELLLCMTLIYVYYQAADDIWSLYNTIKWSGFIISLYTIITQGFSEIIQYIINSERMYVVFANINLISMAAAFSVVITIYEILFKKKNIISILLCMPCILIISAFSTRKALLVVILGLAMLLFWRYSSKNILKTLSSVFVVIIVLSLLFNLLSILPMFSGIMNRMEGLIAFITGDGKIDNSTYIRNLYIKIGMEGFLKNPFIGIGIGNSGIFMSSVIESETYFHNNFVELLCCGGIVGFTIYYSMFVYCGWELFKHRNDDSMVKLALSLILTFLAMDIARVTYYSKTTIFYVMVFFLHIKSLNKTVEINETKKNT